MYQRTAGVVPADAGTGTLPRLGELEPFAESSALGRRGPSYGRAGSRYGHRGGRSPGPAERRQSGPADRRRIRCRPRTQPFPAGARFSPAQRQVHDLVERAHRAGLAAVGPGRPFTDFHHAAMEVIAGGLHDRGLLPVSVDEALSPQGQHHRRYVVCGIGHHLGLDVHDCARSTQQAYHGARMAAGMVLTVEPGLYFHAHERTVPPELRGIGVRIEDDVLVTPEGSEVLSEGLPIDSAGLEQWMRTR